MKHQITSKDIFNYIQGNGRLALDKLGLSQPHIKEQVAYRLLMCKDTCVPEGRCRVCHCPLPGRAFTSASCNKGEIFPDLMNEEDWFNFKQDNNIE